MVAATPSDEFGSPLQGDDSPTPGAAGTKRKSEDGAGGGSQTQQRAKRNRYISIACNECKRRKIKCNGETPCQRCGNMNLDCVYAPNCCNGFKDSQEYKEMAAHLAQLQNTVNSLHGIVEDVRGHLGSPGVAVLPLPHTPIDPALQPAHHFTSHPAVAALSPAAVRPRSQSHNANPTFRGPMSNDFNFGVAKSSLQTMGITSHNDTSGDGSGGAGSGTREGSPAANSPRPPPLQHLFHAEKDPIWAVSHEEALRLCDVYEDEMGVMYPVLDIEKVKAYADKLYTFMNAARRAGLFQPGRPGADALDDAETSILKLVLATGMVTETGGRNELGRKMYERVQPSLDSLLLDTGSVNGIRMLAMAAMYEFHRDHEGTSWRLIGLAARLCIELGLHRRETYDAVKDPAERMELILVFWSIYVLDRRWAFGTGMPYALQDTDIDPMLPKPEGRSPYLGTIIEFYGLGAKVWHAVTSSAATGRFGNPIDTELIERLDYQLVQWHKNVPPHLYFDPSKLDQNGMLLNQAPTRAGRRLPMLLYLRRNLMRISLYRPVLLSATSIVHHRNLADKAVNLAKETIRLLTLIRSTTDLYESQQMLFNAFLSSALGALFLAVAHTPAAFADAVREEYYMGVELVRHFSKESYVGKRMWKAVRILSDVAPKLGLASKDRDPLRSDPRLATTTTPSAVSSSVTGGDLDASHSAAVAMAGLAGHNVDEMALHHGGWMGNVEPASSTSPDALANNLSSLFERQMTNYPAQHAQHAAAGNGSVDAATTSNGHVLGVGAGGDGVVGGVPPGLEWGLSEQQLANILEMMF